MFNNKMTALILWICLLNSISTPVEMSIPMASADSGGSGSVVQVVPETTTSTAHSTEPTEEFYSGCNTSLIEEKYLDPIKPISQNASMKNPYGLYASHVKKKQPMWCAIVPNGETVSVEFYFVHPMLVTGIITTGSPSFGFVETYTVSYGASWEEYKDESTNTKIFSASRGQHANLLSRPFVTTQIRFKLVTMMDHPCIHFDVKGCYQGNFFCPKNFTSWGGHCYSYGQGGNYTQRQARDMCQDINSDLLVVESEAEKQFLEKIIPSEYWMSLARQQDFTHLWSSNKPVDYTNWEDGQPHGSEHYNQETNTYLNFRGLLASDSLKWVEKTYAYKGAASVCYNTSSQADCFFHYWNGTCFYVNTTQLQSQMFSENLCLSIGFKQLTIMSEEEQLFIDSIVPTGPWTGLIWSPMVNNFTYGKGLNLTNYNWTYWKEVDSSGKSAPSGFSEELDCVIARATNNSKLPLMRDDDCKAEHAFVCEKIAGSTTCLEEWVPYNNSCYKLITTKLTWTLAGAYCSNESAHLLVLSSLGEHEFITDYLPKYYWIGLNGGGVLWMWHPTNENLTGYNNFLHGRVIPSYSGQAVKARSSDGLWYSESVAKLLPYLCAYTAASSTEPSIADFSQVKICTNHLEYVTSPPVEIKASDCIPHENCVFPFWYYWSKKTFTECTDDLSSRFWCSFKKQYYASSDAWAFCNCSSAAASTESQVTKTICTEFPKPVLFWPFTDKYNGLDLSGHKRKAKLTKPTFISLSNPVKNDTDKVNVLQIIDGSTSKISTHLTLKDSFSIFMHINWIGNQIHNSTLLMFGNNLLYKNPLNESEYLRKDNFHINITNGDYTELHCYIPSFGKISIPFNFTTMQWNSIGTTYNKSQGTFKIWINGNMISETYNISSNVDMMRQGSGVHIGYRYTDHSYKRRFSRDQTVKNVALYCIQMYATDLDESQLQKAATLCEDVPKAPVNKTIICENQLATLQCSGNSGINIISADFGRNKNYLSGICNTISNGAHGYCMIDVTNKVTKICQNQKRCDFAAHLDTFIKDKYYLFRCDLAMQKYLEIYWNCEETDPCNEWPASVYKNGKCYKPKYEPLEWSGAKDDCLPGGLVNIYNQESMTEVMGMMPTEVWLGLDDNKSETVFVDYNGVRPTYMAWESGYPKQDSLAENCVQVAFKDDKIAMNDANCDLKRSPMCKSWYNASACNLFRIDVLESLHVGEMMCSEDGMYQALLQFDGNFVVKGPNTTVYASGTRHDNALRIKLDTKGKLVMHTSDTFHILADAGSTSTFASITNDGHLVIKSKHGSILWSARNNECKRTRLGYDYMGSNSESSEGFGCQSWSDSLPNSGIDLLKDISAQTGFSNIVLILNLPSSWLRPCYVSGFPDYAFPELNKTAAGKFCRNPTLSKQTEPGCYLDLDYSIFQSCTVPDCDDGYTGYKYQNCISLLKTLDAEQCFSYSPSDASKDTGETRAAFALIGTPYIAGEQIGGVCLTWSSALTHYLQIELVRSEKVSGIVLDGPANSVDVLSGQILLTYLNNRFQWIEHELLAKKMGKHQLKKSFTADRVRVYIHCDYYSCKTSKHCFRIDLLKCSDNLINRDVYPMFREAVSSYIAQTDVDNLLEFSNSGTFATPVMKQPALQVKLSQPLYVLGIIMKYSFSVDMTAEFIIEVHSSFDDSKLTPDTIPTDNSRLCTKTTGVILAGASIHNFWCEKVLKGNTILIYSTTTDDRLVFRRIQALCPSDGNAFEQEYMYKTADNSLNSFVASFPTISSEKKLIEETKYKKFRTLQRYAHIDVPTGVLNDGMLFSGHCLTLPTQNDPLVYIRLPHAVWVAEVRITGPNESQGIRGYDLMVNKKCSAATNISTPVSSSVSWCAEQCDLNDKCRVFEYNSGNCSLQTGCYQTFILDDHYSALYYKVDELVNLNIHVEEMSYNYMSYTPDHYRYKPQRSSLRGNCHENFTPFKLNDTRSFMCDYPIYGNYIYIYLRQSYSRMRLCEVEIYEENDKSDITTPSYDSGWIDYSNFYTYPIVPMAHNLGVLPIYGRLLSYDKNSIGDPYIYETDAFQEHQQYDIGFPITLSYNEFVFWVDGEQTPYISLQGTHWTDSFLANVNDTLKPDLRFRVQLWTECAFPRPNFMSSWNQYTSMEVMLNDTHTVMPVFGIAQVMYRQADKRGIEKTMQIRGLKSNNYNSRGAFMFSTKGVLLALPESQTIRVLKYRILLWTQLGKARPTFTETYNIVNGVGPELLKMPPYSPELSLVIVTMNGFYSDTGYDVSASGMSLGKISNLVSYNHEFMRMWWRVEPDLDIYNINITNVSISVYRTGAPLNYTKCNKLDIPNSNIFGECGDKYEPVDIYCDAGNLDYNNKTIGNTSAQCMDTSGMWSLHQICAVCPSPPLKPGSRTECPGSFTNMSSTDCDKLSAGNQCCWSTDGEPFCYKNTAVTGNIHWIENEGYEYTAVDIGSMNYSQGVAACKMHGAYILALTSQRQVDFLLEMIQKPFMNNLTSTNNISLQLYIDAWRSQPSAVDNSADILESVTAHTYKHMNGQNQCVQAAMTMNKVNHLSHETVVWLDNVDCSAERIVYCQRQACHEDNTHHPVAYKHRKPEISPEQSMSSIFTDLECIKICQSQYNCSSAAYDYQAYTCFLYDQPLEIERNLDMANYYDQITSYNFVCDKANESSHWELLYALDTTAEDANLTSLFSSEIINGSVVFPSDLSGNNISTFKSQRMLNWDYVTQIKLAFFSSSGEEAFITMRTDGVPLNSGDRQTLASSLDLTYGDKNWLSSCVPDISDLVKRSFIISTSGMPCNHSTHPYTDDPSKPLAMYKTANLNATSKNLHPLEAKGWKVAEALAFYANTFCWASVGTTRMSTTDIGPQNVMDTTFFSFNVEYYSNCASRRKTTIYLYQYPFIKDSNAYELQINVDSSDPVVFKVWKKRYVIHEETHKIANYFCSTNKMWVAWKYGVLQFGVGSVYDVSKVMTKVTIPEAFSINYLSLESQGKVSYPKRASCLPLILENATEPIYQMYGPCVKTIRCKEGHELISGAGWYETSCNSSGLWSRVEDCKKVFCRNINFENSDVQNVDIMYGDILEVTCNNTYYVSGDNQRTAYNTTCTGRNKIQPVEQCTRILCSDLTIAHSNVTAYGGENTDTVTIQCASGYELAETGLTSYTAECLPSKNWAPAYYCQRINCTALNVTLSNTTDYNDGRYGDIVTVACDTGHAISCQMTTANMQCPESYFTTCTASKTWSYYQKCNKKLCEPLDVTHSNASSVTGKLYGDLVTVMCDDKYLIESTGNSTYITQCGADTKWAPFAPCFRILCSDLTIAHSNVTAYGGENTDTVTIQCASGYELAETGLTSYTAECLPSKNWAPAYYCQRINCTALNVTLSNTTDYNDGRYSDIVTVACDTGHSVSCQMTNSTLSLQAYMQCTDSYLTTCTANKTWSHYHQCNKKLCEPLDVTRSNASSVIGKLYGDIVTVTCDDKYLIESTGNSTYTTQCGPETKWTLFAPCVRVICDNLTIAHSNMTGYRGINTDMVTVQCDSGYEVTATGNDSYTTECMGDKSWAPVHQCQRINCIQYRRAHSNVSHAYVEGRYGDTITVQCDMGFATSCNLATLSSSSGAQATQHMQCVEHFDTHCLANKTWSGDEKCRHKKCEPLIVDHSDASYYDVWYQGTRNVTCDNGYKLDNGSDTYTTTCTHTTLWNPLMSCEPVNCGPVVLPDTLEQVGSIRNLTLGNTISYRCAVGYGAMEGNHTIECLHTGNWTQLPMCYADCPALSEVQFSSLSSNDTTYNTTVAIQCTNSSLYVNGTNTLRCLSNGQWSGDVPDCAYKPVDGVWNTWVAWTDCSASCGEGTKSRTRTCTPPRHKGLPCSGANNETTICTIQPCIGNGQWTFWTSWTSCSVSCGGGTRTRDRQCEGHYGAGLSCVGNTTDGRQCSTQNCPLVSCSAAPEFGHTRRIGESQLIGSVVVYLCEGLREFTDGTREKVVTCTKYGAWEPYRLPKCQYMKCPEFTPPPHTSISTTDRFIYTNVTFNCGVGYNFTDGTGSRTLTCQKNRVWSHEPPTCYSELCFINYTTEDHHSSVSTFTKISTSYGDQVTVYCNQGSRFANGLTALTIECGKEQSLQISCKTSHCPPVPLVSNASVVLHNETHFTIECFVGHRFSDGYQQKTIRCLSNAQWDQEYLGPCLVITCPPVQQLSNALPNTSNAIYGSTVKYKCTPGYLFPDRTAEGTIECLYTGLWSNILYDCTEVNCGLPPSVGNSSSTYHNTSLNSVAAYKCDEFHRFSDGYTTNNITCTETGHWQQIDAACQIERCEPVPIPKNAVSDTRIAVIDTVANITCVSGYTLPGGDGNSQVTVCDRFSRMWSLQPQDCVAVKCDEIVPANEMILSSSVHHYPNIVNITCNNGYELIDWSKNTTAEMMSVQCQQNQLWSRELKNISCERVSCGHQEPLIHTKQNGTGQYYGDKITYSCNFGFHFQDDSRSSSKEIECMADGTWSEYIRKGCQIAHCGNLSHYTATMNTTETMYSTILRITCAVGFKFTGAEYHEGDSIVTTCTADGQWVPDVPFCQDNTRQYVDLGPPEEATGGGGIAFVTSLLLSAIVIGIVSIDILTYWTFGVALLARNVGHLIPQLQRLVKKEESASNQNRGQEYAVQGEQSDFSNLSRKSSQQSMTPLNCDTQMFT